MTRRWLSALEWVGVAAGLAGAVLVALNIPASGWGFALFLASSTALGAVAAVERRLAAFLLFAGYTAINLLGIWRWLT